MVYLNTAAIEGRLSYTSAWSLTHTHPQPHTYPPDSETGAFRTGLGFQHAVFVSLPLTHSLQARDRRPARPWRPTFRGGETGTVPTDQSIQGQSVRSLFSFFLRSCDNTVTGVLTVVMIKATRANTLSSIRVSVLAPHPCPPLLKYSPFPYQRARYDNEAAVMAQRERSAAVLRTNTLFLESTSISPALI